MHEYSAPLADERAPAVSQADLDALGLLPGFTATIISAGEL